VRTTVLAAVAVASASPTHAAPIEPWRDTNVLVEASRDLELVAIALDRRTVDCAAYARVAPKIKEAAARIPAIRAARARILDATYKDWRQGHEPLLLRQIAVVARLRRAHHCSAVHADDAAQNIGRTVMALLERPSQRIGVAPAGCQAAMKQSFAETEVWMHGLGAPPEPLDAFFAEVELVDRMRAIDAAPDGACVPFGGKPAVSGGDLGPL
jgi:hypothetical protein